MNIFYLDDDIEKCAQYHVDSHVVKMILESAQILCTALTLHGISTPYKPTHIKHPCVLWAAASLSNWMWLRKLAQALNTEFLYRWKKTSDHKSYVVVNNLPSPKNFMQDLGITERPQAMPKEYIVPNDPIQAYRKYYSFEKKALHRYTRRNVPEWLPYSYNDNFI